MHTLPSVLTLVAAPWAQERAWEWNWETSTPWWPLIALAAGLALFVLFVWGFLSLAPIILAVLGAVFGIRWLAGIGDRRHADPALAILRERYARGEISKEEFEAKMRDLAAR